MQEMTLDAIVVNLDKVLGFLDGQLEAVSCPLKVQTQLDIALEELFVNIASYAYPGTIGQATIRISVTETEAVITLVDQGIPYDPLKKKDPDVTLSAEERQIGGLGIYMVKKSMDEISYEYKDGRNILTFMKKLR